MASAERLRFALDTNVVIRAVEHADAAPLALIEAGAMAACSWPSAGRSMETCDGRSRPAR